MNVPIRVLGIATSIFWIILIAFIASAAYSMKDLGFSVGEPLFSAGSNGELQVSLPLYFDNKGFYSIKSFNLSTVFLDADDSVVSSSSTFVPVIPSGQQLTVYHNVTLRIDNLGDGGGQFLFEDADLKACVTAGLTFAELLPSQISSNTTFPWGAPFYDFGFGEPAFRLSGLAMVPVSFENHAGQDLVGNLTVRLYDSGGSFLAETEAPLNVTQYDSFASYLQFLVPASAVRSSAVSSGHFEVYFKTSVFEAGPVVIPYG